MFDWKILGVTLAFTCTAANAALVISKDATSNVNCASGVCAATSANAVLNVKDLKKILSKTDLKIVSGSEAQDIEIDATLTWARRNSLTLDAWRGIAVSQPMTSEGKGGVTLTVNDGGSGGDYVFLRKGALAFWDLGSKLVINGGRFTLINSIAMLANDIAGNPSGQFALANSYDASVDGTYSASPVSTAVTGWFEGLGDTIANLSISSSESGGVGLFKKIDVAGRARDILLTNAEVQDPGNSGVEVGSLAGDSWGTIENSQANATIIGGYFAGALIGMVDQGGVRNCASSGSVVVGFNGEAGGLVGSNYGAITSSFSNAKATGFSAGGLAGASGGSVALSHASGAVATLDGSGVAGGLIGSSEGSISQSYATGSVSGVNMVYAGGLAGIADGDVTLSFATGNVSSASRAGGLVGVTGFGTISKSFATGNVTISDNAYGGGLVGESDGNISNSYSFGRIKGTSANSVAGGLVGLNYGTSVGDDFATGKVTASGIGNVGGSIGFDGSHSGSIAADYWDEDTSAIHNSSQGAGNIANDPGIAGLSDTELKSSLPTGFDPAIWSQNASINKGYPYLIDNRPPR